MVGGGLLTVKFVALVAVPPRVVTVIGPVVAPPETSAARLVADAAVTVASTPVNLTWFSLATGSKLAPVIVTAVPTGPLAGGKTRSGRGRNPGELTRDSPGGTPPRGFCR